MRAFTELQREGKIRMWGMSNLDVAHMEEVLSLPEGRECATDQVLYNLKERGVEYDLLPWCTERHIPLMAYTPLGEGQLRDDHWLHKIADRHGATTTQIMLAWLLRNPDVIAIPKAGSVAHVEENARALDIELTDEDLRDIDRAFPRPTRKVPLAGW